MLERKILTFAGNTLKSGSSIEIKILEYNSKAISKATAFAFGRYENLLPLYEKGAVLVEVEGKEYALVYKGEKLIQGNPTDKYMLKFFQELKKTIKNPEKLKDILEIAYKEAINKIVLSVKSKLDPLIFNSKLSKQIASKDNYFKRYFIRIERGSLIEEGFLFTPKTHADNWVDWIITSENELKFGHGHAFLSNNSKLIKNAGTALIKDGKIIKISNFSGHYLPSPNYLDEAINIFKELDIISDTIQKFRVKPKK